MHLVLVVEDEPLIRIFISDVLIEVGYEVLEAVSGDEALELLRTPGAIAAAVIDVELPGSIDGFGVAKVARDNRPDMVILIASGRAWPRDGQVPEGAVWVQKPYSAEFLIQTLADRLVPPSNEASRSAAILTDNPSTQGRSAEPVLKQAKVG